MYRTRHVLAFERLSPADFERLCFWLLQKEGFSDVRHLGAAGNEGGCDLAARRDGRPVAVQCKRVDRFGPADAAEAIVKFLQWPLTPPAKAFLLLVSTAVSRSAQEKAQERAGEVPVEVWARTELDAATKRHPEIVEEFFGRFEAGPFVAPAPPSQFTGRGAVLDTLAERLLAGDDIGLTAIQGMGGIGKTAVAQKLAERLVRDHNDVFPGGVLWWELGPEPDVLSALASWARTANPKADLAGITDIQSRAAVVRQLLADHGKVCVMLDDVWRADIARPFLAAIPPGCPRLVTTRDGDVVKQLRCEVHRLDVLDLEEGFLLLAKHVGDLAGHEAAARRIVELTEGLPLALEIAAGLVDAASDLPALVAELEKRPRLEVLTLAAQREDSVEICFTLSYRALEEDDQRRFRALGTFAEAAPFDEAALAAVWGEATVTPAASRLMRRSLLLRDPETRHFRQHALLLSFARALLARAGESEEIAVRHADYYQQLAGSASWQVVESVYEQIRHAWRQIADKPIRAPEFALAALAYQIKRGRWQDRVEWLETAHAYTTQGADHGLHDKVLQALGRVYSALGRKEEALRRYEEALEVLREVGDRRGEGTTLNHIAAIYDDLGREEEALRRYEEALSILREVGAEGETLNHIGFVYSALGRPEEALRRFEEALRTHREAGDRNGEGETLSHIGFVDLALGRKKEALRCFEEARLIFREAGDRGGEGATLNNIARVYSSLGRKEKALGRLKEALQLLREVGERGGEGATLTNIAGVCFELGRREEALRRYEEACRICREMGDGWGEAAMWFNIGLVLAGLGRFTEATEALQNCVTLDEALGHPDLEFHRTMLARTRAGLER